jgi:DNA (cytosine-5)-methyltransferase 1
MSEMSIADLFCGPGGASIGFNDFFDVTLAVDWKPDPCRTYRKNLTGVVKQKDIRNLSGSQKDFDGIMGVIAGPPCKPFSMLNTRKDPNDPRRNLWKDFMRIVEEVKPKFFLMENVPTIFNDIKKGILNEGKRLGYIVSHKILDSSNYGVPQTRKRWIVVGTKKPFAFPSAQPSIAKTVKTAFDQIQENKGFGNTRPKTLERFSEVPVGKWVPISSGRFRNAIRLSWNHPAPTVINITKVYMIHPLEIRLITETEAAVLQDFPPDYGFVGNRTSRTQQIADAAPASLMRAIAKQLQS